MKRRSGSALFAAALLTLLFLSGPSLAAQPASATVVLKGATLIDGLGGAPVSDAVLVIEGNQIKSILQGKDARTPPQAKVVDLSGKTIIPGIFDSHVHWVDWMGELYVNHGVTSVLALADVPAAERTASETNQTSPRVFHTGPRLLTTRETKEDDIRQGIRLWLSKKPDIAWLTELGWSNREVYGKTIDLVHREGFQVFSHAQHMPLGIDLGLDVAEHIWGFAQALMTPAELESFQKGEFPTWAVYLKAGDRLDGMIRTAIGRDVHLNPTLVYEWGSMSGSTARREQEAYQLFRDPGLPYVQPGISGALLIHHRQIKNFSARYEHWPMLAQLTPGDLQKFREGYANVQQFVRRWVQLGGKVIAGSDSGTVAIPGLGMHHEMELLVEAGLTPMQALQSATSWGAEILAGRSGARGNPRIGSLKEGNFADLVVLGANPLADITNTRKIERVMKNGRFVTLGYHPEFATTTPGPVGQSAPTPEISAISPHDVTEGSPALTLVIDGVGFSGTSVARADGVSVETRFDSPRKLTAIIPAAVLARATPDRFASPGPELKVGVFGDRTVRITVYTPNPVGGVSNSVSLRVRARWN